MMGDTSEHGTEQGVTAAGLALASDPGVIERSADPAEFVVQACERAKAWLRVALEHWEIEQIAEIKSRAEAVRVYTTQKQIGKDAQLAATEVVRRAERGIGLAIRRGQRNGEIRRRGDRGRRPDANGAGNTIYGAKPGPADYATVTELRGNGAGIYHLTDAVSDADFEDALAGARAEGDLSRANVVRKIHRRHDVPPGAVRRVPDPADRSPEAATRRRELLAELAAAGMSSAQIGDRLRIGGQRVRQLAREHCIDIRADAVLRGTRGFDSNRIARQTVRALEGLAMGVELANLSEVNPAEAGEWATSMTRSLRVLSRFARQLREVAST
jgi:hypothetical protein